jgi:hypothetical protein
MLEILRSDAYQEAVNRLPGYQAVNCGRVLSLAEAFKSFADSSP